MFTLQVDASDEGLGASLTQRRERKEVVIGYASRLLTETERKYTTTEKECLALVWAVKKFRPYIEGYRFKIITDHVALKWLLRLKEPSGRLARWVLEVQQHDFEVVYRKGTANKVADALSRNPVGSSPSMVANSPVCPIMREEKTPGNSEKNTKKIPPKGKRDVIPLADKPENDRDVWFERVVNYARKHPSRTGKYVEREGRVYVSFNRKKDGQQDGQWKMCVPLVDREKVLQETHDSPTAGHFGVKKTAKKVADSYYWPGWRKHVRSYVRNCEVCQKYKVEQTKPAGKMHYRPPRGPWHTVSADLLGPLPRSKRGNTFILAFQDQYSKWTELVGLKAATASQVTAKFREYVRGRATPTFQIVSPTPSEREPETESEADVTSATSGSTMLSLIPELDPEIEQFAEMAVGDELANVAPVQTAAKQVGTSGMPYDSSPGRSPPQGGQRHFVVPSSQRRTRKRQRHFRVRRWNEDGTFVRLRFAKIKH